MTCVCVCKRQQKISHSVAWRVSASATEDSHSVACSSWHERYCPTHPTPPHPHPKRHRLHFHFCSSWHEPYCPTYPTPPHPHLKWQKRVLYCRFLHMWMVLVTPNRVSSFVQILGSRKENQSSLLTNFLLITIVRWAFPHIARPRSCVFSFHTFIHPSCSCASRIQ